MSSFPCGSHCPTYAMCKLRDPSVKYNICALFSKYIVDKFFENEKNIKEEHGENMTLIGITVPGEKYLLSRDGKKVGKKSDWKDIEENNVGKQKGGGAII